MREGTGERTTGQRIRSAAMKPDRAALRAVFIAVLLITLLGWTVGLVYGRGVGNQRSLFFKGTKDFLADYTNVLGYSAINDPYYNEHFSGPEEKVYPPLTYVAMFRLSWLGDIRQYTGESGYSNFWHEPLITIAYILMTAAVLLGFYEALRHHFQGKRTARVLMSGLMVFSAPFLYTIERGNTVLAAALLSMIFIMNYDSPNKWAREAALGCLALATALKITPAILGLLLLTERKGWKAAIRAGIYGIICVFVPFLFLARSPWENLTKMIDNILVNARAYSVTEGCALEACFLKLGIQLPETAGTILRYAVAAVLLAGTFLARKKWMRVMMTSLVLVTVPGHSGQYCLLYLIPAYALFLNEEEHSAGDWMILAGTLLTLQPMQGKAVELFLNSGLGLLMLCGTMICQTIRLLLRRTKSGAGEGAAAT